MIIKILDAATLGEDMSLSLFDSLGEVTVYPRTTEAELKERIADAEILVLNKIKLGASNLEGARSLRLICVTATGYDNIDVDWCSRRGIGVTNVKGYSTDSVAQVTVATVLSLACHLREYDAHCRSGAYSCAGVQNCLAPTFYELRGKTWGVVGLGNIGSRVGKIASALGCRVIGARKRTERKSRFEAVDLDKLCCEADIITVHTPLTEDTRAMISRDRIARMKQGAILVNAARGAVVDEEAVAEAVLCGKIAFGCDVFSVEPFPKDHPYSRLSGCSNLLLTPHMAWGAYEARLRCLEEVAENIRAFQRGERRSRVD